MTIALITGGSRGLGRSMALHLAERGNDIIITYVANPDAARATVEAIQARGRRAAALKLDVAQAQTFPAFADALRDTLATWGVERFDHLVNNAGIAGHASFAETSEAQFDELMKVHLKGPFFLTQALLPLIADGGKILNVTTGLTRFSFPGYSAYATMKGGVETLTHYLAKELAPRRIAVNSIAPGAIATDFGGGRVRDNADLNKIIAGVTAMGRVGEADDVGAAVASLLSDGGWMTGQRVEVSGGMFL